MSKLTKTHIIAVLASVHGLSKLKAKAILEHTINMIGQELLFGCGRVCIPQLGTFNRVETPARTMTLLGKTYSVPAKKRVKFKPAKILR